MHTRIYYIYACGVGLPIGHVDVCTTRPLEFQCTSGSVIAIVSARFGRFDRHACGVDQSRLCEFPGFYLFEELQRRCFKKTRCTLLVTPKLVYRREPCPGVHKYLSLTYECMKSNDALHLC